MRELRARGIDAFTLKLIAIAAMAVDHVGYVFFPTAIWMRVIGRLTLPIMAFLIAEGYAHTRSLSRYARRLLIAAALSAVPFSLAFGIYRLGVMWTLLLGLLALAAMDRIANRGLRALAVVACVFASMLGDWPIYGALIVLAFGLLRGNFAGQAVALTALLILHSLDAQLGGATFNPALLWTGAGVLALPLLYLYNGQRGRDLRYLFYGFYPAHLAIIAAVNLWLLPMLRGG